MAFNNVNAPMMGKICCGITIHGRDYCEITFGIIPGLCADVILSQDFLKRQKQIIIHLKGSQENLFALNDATQ